LRVMVRLAIQLLPRLIESDRQSAAVGRGDGGAANFGISSLSTEAPYAASIFLLLHPIKPKAHVGNVVLDEVASHGVRRLLALFEIQHGMIARHAKKDVDGRNKSGHDE
jgi:hypothetical protein